MEVSTNIKRTDLIYLNLVLLPRVRSTYVTMISIAVVVFVFLAWEMGYPQSTSDWFSILAGSISGGVFGMLAGVVISSIYILASSSGSDGIIGKHEYRITAEGLYESTSVNEGLNKWEGVQEVRLAGPYVLFKITGYLFHVIPKRSFADEKAFREFLDSSVEYWKHSHKKAN